MPDSCDARTLRERLRDGLTRAMKERDRATVSALRSALAAIDNAEAVDPAHAPPSRGGRIAGTVGGLGAGEVPRRTLSSAEVTQVLQAEVTQREAAAVEYERLGRADEAARLRAEAAALERALRAR